jgi:cell pole-organizing protein PopZ
MTQPAKSQEPSMEEILASIRRIIADDDATKTAPRAGDPAKAAVAAPAAPPPAPPPPQAAAPPPQAAAQPPPPRPRVEPQPQRAEPPRVEPPSVAPARPAAPQAATDQSDILDLTESMEAPMPPAAAASPAPSAAPQTAPQFRTIDGASDIGFDEPANHPAVPPPGDDRGRLLSSGTSAAVDSAFTTLAQTVLMQNARTLDDLVREMLRPMLKTWLDDNLPGMVERLVRSEIERVSRGRSS